MNDYRELVERFRTAMFEQRDAKAAAMVYANDATYFDALTPAGATGRQAVERNLEAYLRAFSDLSGEVTNLFGAGEWFAVEVTTRGTNDGPISIGPGETVPPTGRHIEVPGCWICRVDADGLIAEDHTYFDVASLTEQLGLRDQAAAA